MIVNEASWYIVAVKKCKKNGKFALSLGIDTEKAIGGPVIVSETDFWTLLEHLLGKRKGKPQNIVGLSIPRTDTNPRVDIDKELLS